MRDIAFNQKRIEKIDFVLEWLDEHISDLKRDERQARLDEDFDQEASLEAERELWSHEFVMLEARRKSLVQADLDNAAERLSHWKALVS